MYTLRFFSSKYSLFHNSNVFGSCIIHILYRGCAKIKKKIRPQKVKFPPRPAFTRRTRGYTLGTLTTVDLVSVTTARAAVYLSLASVERGIVQIDMCAGFVMTSLPRLGVITGNCFHACPIAVQCTMM